VSWRGPERWARAVSGLVSELRSSFAMKNRPVPLAQSKPSHATGVRYWRRRTPCDTGIVVQ
jgi:hypothetical protein